MKKTVILLHLLFCSFILMAQETIALWPEGSVPNSKPSTIKEEREVTDILRIRNVQQPTIEVYLPVKRNATGQAVVICPGGGYSILAYEWEGTEVAKWLNAHGIAAIVLKYRLPDARTSVAPYKSPLLDAQRALRIVRANATKWNVQKNKIGIMGFSAGGHLASTAGTRFDSGNASATDSVERFSSRPDFTILMYPVITLSKPYMHKGSATNLLGQNPSSELAEAYSSDLQVTAQTPPTFVVHASDDQVVPVENSIVFYQALVKNKVPAELHIYPYGGHGFGLAVGRGYLESWTDRCIDWLRSINK